MYMFVIVIYVSSLTWLLQATIHTRELTNLALQLRKPGLHCLSCLDGLPCLLPLRSVISACSYIFNAAMIPLSLGSNRQAKDSAGFG